MKDMTLENAMNDTNKRNAKAKAAKRTRLRALVVAAALMMGTQNAYAGWPVIDITSIMGEVRSWIDDTTEYAKEAVRWDDMKKQIDSIRNIFSALNFAIGLAPGEKLVKVDPRYMVEETCGSDTGGLSISTVMAVMGMDIGGDLKKQQQQICVNIQMMQNRKYNESVDFLDRTIKQAETAMAENFASRNGSENSVGSVQAATSDTARLGNQLNVIAQQWNTQVQAYDAYIETMEQRQNLLAKVALKGKRNKLAKDLVQTAALKAALSID